MARITKISYKKVKATKQVTKKRRKKSSGKNA